MARQRRGGGFKPPELRGTLGTLLRTAATQIGPLRDAIGRTARDAVSEGRSRFDDARARFDTTRRRSDALAELGEVILDLIRRGEIDLGELPEVRDIVAHLDEMDAGGTGTGDDDYADQPEQDDEPPPRPPAKSRFDSRRRDASTPAPGKSPAPRRRGAADDDGTTSSRTWAPPNRPANKPAARVWRPPVDEPDEPPAPIQKSAARTPPLPRAKDPLRQGGISFDSDDDLAEYMHPDDVPPKKPSDSDS